MEAPPEPFLKFKQRCSECISPDVGSDMGARKLAAIPPLLPKLASQPLLAPLYEASVVRLMRVQWGKDLGMEQQLCGNPQGVKCTPGSAANSLSPSF